MKKREEMSDLETALTAFGLAGVMALYGTIACYEFLDRKREVESEAKSRSISVEEVYKERQENYQEANIAGKIRLNEAYVITQKNKTSQDA